MRCNNPNASDYSYYGGRGISIDPVWNKYESFSKWAHENGYKEDLTIDRIDTNGNYSPDNCRWADRVQQARNTRRNVYVTYKGKRMLQKDFAGYIGIGCKTVTRYLRNHRLDGTILVEGGVNDNIKEMQGREPLWLTS